MLEEPGALVALLGSLAFGALSAVVPVVNAEAYVAATRATLPASALGLAVAVGLGQAIGKTILFAGVRWGTRRYTARQRTSRRPPGPWRTRWAAVTDALLRALGSRRWGVPVVLLAALVGMPPLYAVALIAGASPMPTGWFVTCVAVGRVARFVLISLGVGAGLPLLAP